MTSTQEPPAAHARRIRRRPAGKSDCRLPAEWGNQPSVRRFFFDSDEIPFAVHEAWFADALSRADRIILVAQHGDLPVGVIRFDMDASGKSAEVDIYIDPRKHGKRLGTNLLEVGKQWVLANTPIRALKARVTAGNDASMRMFKRCGFRAHYTQLVKELRQGEP